MTAAEVAREGYAAMMAGKPEVIAGARNRWMILSTRLAPRSYACANYPAIEYEYMSMEQVFEADESAWSAAHAGEGNRRCAGADSWSGFGCECAAAGEPVAGVLRCGTAGAALRSAVSCGARGSRRLPRRRRATAKAWLGRCRRCASGRRGAFLPAGIPTAARQTAMIAAERPGLADGLLLLSYPLHPPRKPEQPRTAFFPEWRTPALFVHGTRDPFGTPRGTARRDRTDSGARGSAGGGRRGPRSEAGGAHGRGDPE